MKWTLNNCLRLQFVLLPLFLSAYYYYSPQASGNVFAMVAAPALYAGVLCYMSLSRDAMAAATSKVLLGVRHGGLYGLLFGVVTCGPKLPSLCRTLWTVAFSGVSLDTTAFERVLKVLLGPGCMLLAYFLIGALSGLVVCVLHFSFFTSNTASGEGQGGNRKRTNS